MQDLHDDDNRGVDIHDFDAVVNQYVAARGVNDFDQRAAGFYVLKLIAAGRKYLNDDAADKCGVHDTKHHEPADHLVNQFVVAYAEFILTRHDDGPHLAAAAALVASSGGRTAVHTLTESSG